MLGQMMSQPLLISSLIAHAERYHPEGEIISVSTTGGVEVSDATLVDFMADADITSAATVDLSGTNVTVQDVMAADDIILNPSAGLTQTVPELFRPDGLLMLEDMTITSTGGDVFLGPTGGFASYPSSATVIAAGDVTVTGNNVAFTDSSRFAGFGNATFNGVAGDVTLGGDTTTIT